LPQAHKTDDLLKALVPERGGACWLRPYRNITGEHYCSSLKTVRDVAKSGLPLSSITSASARPPPPFFTNLTTLMRMGRWTRA